MQTEGNWRQYARYRKHAIKVQEAARRFELKLAKGVVKNLKKYYRYVQSKAAFGNGLWMLTSSDGVQVYEDSSKINFRSKYLQVCTGRMGSANGD